jgi:hypothetical protein
LPARRPAPPRPPAVPTRRRARRARCDAAHARDLLEVEGVAAGLRVDRAGHLADELGRLGLAQRAQPQREHAVVALGAGQREREPLRQPALARGHREQHRRGGRPAHQRRQRLERRRIGPLHVVHPQHQGAHRGQPLEQVPEGAVDAMPVARRDLARHVPQRGQHRGEPRGIGEPQARQAALAQIREVGVERLGPERVGEVALELRRAGAEHRRAVGRGARRQMAEQP